jgi:succinate dehydrogenase/fumarate reductase flavoprotein subunit
MRNPGGRELDFSALGREAHDYLEKCGILFGTPIERLKKMNAPSVQLYRDHGIDLEKEYLEIAVCAQHCNGGLAANAWWESNIRHFFPVGEACGTFGVYRPGGSALNSTQVGSLRAAQSIARRYPEKPTPVDLFIDASQATIRKKLWLMRKLSSGGQGESVAAQRYRAQRRMTNAGAQIRSLSGVSDALETCRAELAGFADAMRVSSPKELAGAFRNYDMLLTQYVFLCAIREYVERSGGSRGSYLVADEAGELPAPGLPEAFRHRLEDGKLSKSVCEVWMNRDTLHCGFEWKPVRPIPAGEPWFETVWSEFREWRETIEGGLS